MGNNMDREELIEAARESLVGHDVAKYGMWLCNLMADFAAEQIEQAVKARDQEWEAAIQKVSVGHGIIIEPAALDAVKREMKV